MPESEQEFWQRHLQACAQCQNALTAAKSVEAQYMQLAFHEAPDRVVQKLLRQVKPQLQAGWLNTFRERIAYFIRQYGFKPRLVFIGSALAVFLIAGFHFLAFQPPAQPAWDAATFDERAGELFNDLDKYNSEVSTNSGDFVEASWDDQIANLRESIAALRVELESAKL
jgi:hypothetical protein